jgi:hypothetical protein
MQLAACLRIVDIRKLMDTLPLVCSSILLCILNISSWIKDCSGVKLTITVSGFRIIGLPISLLLVLLITPDNVCKSST